RADARDRAAHGHRRARQGRSPAVPGRSGRSEPVRRPSGYRYGVRTLGRGREIPAVADDDSAGSNRHGIWIRRGHGRLLRFLSGLEGRATGSDRSSAVRVVGRRAIVVAQSKEISRGRSIDGVFSLIIQRSTRMQRARIGLIATAILAVATVVFAQK